MMVVKNSLARRATEGTPLAAAFEQAEGTWPSSGARDMVAAGQGNRPAAGDKEFAPFEPGRRDGRRAARPPSRSSRSASGRAAQEQLSLLLGQILSPGAMLVSQLTSAGGALASQIKQTRAKARRSGAAAADGRRTGRPPAQPLSQRLNSQHA